MSERTVRIAIDIPAELYRRLVNQAKAAGRPISELVLDGIRQLMASSPPLRRKRLRFPIIVSRGPKVNLTNEQIYDCFAGEDISTWINSGYRRLPF